MEMNWVVRGAYANWSMTVTISPLDVEDCDESVQYTEEWCAKPFTRVYAYFADIVNLLESGRQLDDTTRSGVWVA